eukprot:1190663-Pleurochrysis_carterae.AAC.1
MCRTCVCRLAVKIRVPQTVACMSDGDRVRVPFRDMRAKMPRSLSGRRPVSIDHWQERTWRSAARWRQCRRGENRLLELRVAKGQKAPAAAVEP